jgi:hypothetical protein
MDYATTRREFVAGGATSLALGTPARGLPFCCVARPLSRKFDRGRDDFRPGDVFTLSGSAFAAVV